jgi:23S rRNA (cytidine1920-2'-O)/16S rRNA (cytidine1409-2'-O)-methyltransferase
VKIVERLRGVHDAEALVLAGRVFVGGAPVTNPRAMVDADAPLVVEAEKELRGTLKLRAALEAFAVPIAGRVALDLGASTGGFTTELLARGATRVYAVDAGHGQLLGKLRQDPRVVNLERTNLGEVELPEPAEVVTIDLAYLALARAVPQLARIPLALGADAVALVKPMYELGLQTAPHDDASLAAALRSASDAFTAAGWDVLQTMRSPHPGGRGAIELFLHARRQRAP